MSKVPTDPIDRAQVNNWRRVGRAAYEQHERSAGEELQLAVVNRGSEGRGGAADHKLPPGQHLTDGFLVLSLSATPLIPKNKWELTVTSQTGAQVAGGSSCWSSRMRCCAVRRRTCRSRFFREKARPARDRAARRRGSGGGDVSSTEDRSPAVLPVAGPAGHCRGARAGLSREHRGDHSGAVTGPMGGWSAWGTGRGRKSGWLCGGVAYVARPVHRCGVGARATAGSTGDAEANGEIVRACSVPCVRAEAEGPSIEEFRAGPKVVGSGKSASTAPFVGREAFAEEE